VQLSSNFPLIRHIKSIIWSKSCLAFGAVECSIRCILILNIFCIHLLKTRDIIFVVFLYILFAFSRGNAKLYSVTLFVQPREKISLVLLVPLNNEMLKVHS